jgi:hypothetical protein
MFSWKYAKEYFEHHPGIKFLLVLGVFLTYWFWVSLKFGLSKGFSVTVLTWSFFVLCTPVADAGILLDFPVRLILGIRMIFTESFVWVLAITTNIFFLFLSPHTYESTILLKLFHYILTHPFPFYLIILLSFLGTFLSIIFSDEVWDLIEDKIQHRKHYHAHSLKYKAIIMISIVMFVFLLYTFLLHKLGIDIPLL